MERVFVLFYDCDTNLDLKDNLPLWVNYGDNSV